MKNKNMILAMLVILGMVIFLDRINISVAGSSIMHDLNLSPSEWGWVQSAFILSYGLMQIPMGALGDRFGHRKILAAIVLWWSAFTAFTGLAGGLASLLVIRFMFGIGEAGSSPCSTGVISRWFEKGEVGKAQGYVWAASRMGGALTPFVVIPVMMWVGWRAAFYLLGALCGMRIIRRREQADQRTVPRSAQKQRQQIFHFSLLPLPLTSGSSAACTSSMPLARGSSFRGSPRSWSWGAVSTRRS